MAINKIKLGCKISEAPVHYDSYISVGCTFKRKNGRTGYAPVIFYGNPSLRKGSFLFIEGRVRVGYDDYGRPSCCVFSEKVEFLSKRDNTNEVKLEVVTDSAREKSGTLLKRNCRYKQQPVSQVLTKSHNFTIDLIQPSKADYDITELAENEHILATGCLEATANNVTGKKEVGLYLTKAPEVVRNKNVIEVADPVEKDVVINFLAHLGYYGARKFTSFEEVFNIGESFLTKKQMRQYEFICHCAEKLSGNQR